MSNDTTMYDMIHHSMVKFGKNENNILYHYTTLSGIKGIFSEYIKTINKNPVDVKKYRVNECSLRASNVRYLNDSMEYREGLATLKRMNNSFDMTEIDENIYNISFCKSGNLLSQWDRYGKNSGIAIEFDFNKTRLGYVRHIIDGKEEKKAHCIWPYKPISVKYHNQERFHKELSSEIKEFVSGNIAPIVNAIFVPFCKNIGFEQEEESRIIIYAPHTEEYLYDMDYIIDEDKGTVKPALSVRFETEDATNIVKSFTVGPGKNQDSIFNSLIHIFDRPNYHYYEEDTLAEWAKSDADEEKNKICSKSNNYYFGFADGEVVTHLSDSNEIMNRQIELLKNLNEEITLSVEQKKSIEKAINVIERERLKIIADEIIQDSTNNYIIHRCENGILIKKSLIPYRG